MARLVRSVWRLGSRVGARRSHGGPMAPIQLHDETRTRLQRAAHGTDAMALADAVTATPTSWFDGLDPATAWSLVWIADTATTPSATELIGMAGRFGYRHAR